MKNNRSSVDVYTVVILSDIKNGGESGNNKIHLFKGNITCTDFMQCLILFLKYLYYIKLDRTLMFSYNKL